jgi:hypothetical protein
MPDSAGRSVRQCPSCGSAFPPGPQASCAKCGFAPSAGVVQRDLPHQTRGLEALARKFGSRWSFAFSLLMLIVSGIYYNDIGAAEQQGGSFSSDPFTGIVYQAAGKWAVVALWSAFAVILFMAGLRARKIAGALVR